MKALELSPALYNYVLKYCDLPHPALADLAAETAKLPQAVMQIAPDQGAFMHMLVKLLGARRIIEVGCFTGYSAISMATALPKDGKLISLDIDPAATQLARHYFEKCDVSDRIDLRIGDARQQLAQVESEFGQGSFDMMFIDADKESMQYYFEAGLKLLRKNGLIIADNVLWSAKVIDANDQTPATKAIRAFNDAILADKRVEHVMLGIADGLYLLRKI